MENTHKKLSQYYENAFKKLGADTSKKDTAYFKLCTRFVPTHNIYESSNGSMSSFAYKRK